MIPTSLTLKLRRAITDGLWNIFFRTQFSIKGKEREKKKANSRSKERKDGWYICTM